MVGRVFRALLLGGLVLALWSLARPAVAFASSPASPASPASAAAPASPASLAPFCDDRGATAVAPAPALEATDDAVRRSAALPCDGGIPVDGLTLAPAQPHAAAPVAAAEPALGGRIPRVPLAPSEPLVFTECTTRSPRGSHSRVERPPRG